MRIGSTVLLLNQKCVQSYNWNTLRPLGDLQAVLDSLEEYQTDEVAIVRPVREHDTLSNFEEDIEILHILQTMTPISFGGGIRTIEHLSLLHNLPVERLVFSSAFLSKDKGLLEMAKDLFGHQAIQCLLPVQKLKEETQIYYSEKGAFISLNEVDFEFIETYANEVILLDLMHEGESNSFDFELLKKIPLCNHKLIVSGGIGTESIKSAKEQGLASVLIDNKVLHKEYSIKSYKNVAKMP